MFHYRITRSKAHAKTRLSQAPFVLKLMAAMLALGLLAFAPLHDASAHVESPDGAASMFSAEQFPGGGLSSSFENGEAGLAELAVETKGSAGAMSEIKTYDVAGIQSFVPIVDYLPGSNMVESPELGAAQASRLPIDGAGALSGIKTYDVAGIQSFVPFVDYLPGSNMVESPELGAAQASRLPVDAAGAQSEGQPGAAVDLRTSAKKGPWMAVLALACLISAAYLEHRRRART